MDEQHAFTHLTSQASPSTFMLQSLLLCVLDLLWVCKNRLWRMEFNIIAHQDIQISVVPNNDSSFYVCVTDCGSGNQEDGVTLCM